MLLKKGILPDPAAWHRPAGVINPERMRVNPDSVDFAQQFPDAEVNIRKPVW
jgi:hypothetical protein